MGAVKLWSIGVMMRWTELPAVMEKMEIVELPRDTGTNYDPVVRYRWEVNGTTYRGRRITAADRPFSDRAKAEVIAARWPENSALSCWVNPQRPSEAVLDRWDELDFGIGFTLLGAGFLLVPFFWRRWVSKPWRWRIGDRPPFPHEGWGWTLGLLGSGGLMGFLAVSEAADHWRSRDWHATPCQILESRIVRDGREFKAVVRYQWEAGGKSYDSYRVDWSRLGGGILDSEKISAAHPVGQSETCQVNPLNPAEAVLDPDFTPRGIFYWAFGLLVTLITASGFLSSFKRWRRACRGWVEASAAPVEPDPTDRWSSRWPEHVDASTPAPAPIVLPAPREPWDFLGGWFSRVPRSPGRLVLIFGALGGLGIHQLGRAVVREWDYGYVTVSLVFLIFGALMVLFAAALVIRAAKFFLDGPRGVKNRQR